MAKQNSDYMGMQAQLDEILRRLQSDDIELQEAIELHKKGKELVDQLQTYLKEAENTITKHISDS
jgi:exodeoxyribonuclease VII small subunit